MTEPTNAEVVAEARKVAKLYRGVGHQYGIEKNLDLLADRLEAAEAALTRLRANPRDEYHTMDELYDYRMLYNALAFNAWAAARTFPVVKSWRHSDGELCFGGGWFIVTATLPTGLVSNHYKAEHWDLFQVDDVWYPPEYDGHTPQEAAERLRSLAAAPVSLEAVKAETTEWEYGVKDYRAPGYMLIGNEPLPAEDRVAYYGTRPLIRRHKAGPWEEVEEAPHV